MRVAARRSHIGTSQDKGHAGCILHGIGAGRGALVNARYVIECRDSTGALDFTGLQPETAFGVEAITGITEDQMARRIWSHGLNPVLTGDAIIRWPSFVDPRWSARRKTW